MEDKRVTGHDRCCNRDSTGDELATCDMSTSRTRSKHAPKSRWMGKIPKLHICLSSGRVLVVPLADPNALLGSKHALHIL